LNSVEIKELLIAALPECDFSVEGGDGKYFVTAIGDVFEGLNSVQRQQAIYRILNDYISSGAIHAVSMLVQTKAESVYS